MKPVFFFFFVNVLVPELAFTPIEYIQIKIVSFLKTRCTPLTVNRLIRIRLICVLQMTAKGEFLLQNAVEFVRIKFEIPDNRMEYVPGPIESCLKNGKVLAEFRKNAVRPYTLHSNNICLKREY